MTPEAARALTDGLANSLGGGWQMVLWATREGVPEALGMTTRQWVASLGGYVRMPIAERREAARQLVEGEGLSQRAAADVLGVDPMTVNHDVRLVENSTDAPERCGANTWARRIEAVSAECPIGDLVIDEIEEIRGAATFLRDMCTGELTIRGTQCR